MGNETEIVTDALSYAAEVIRTMAQYKRKELTPEQTLDRIELLTSSSVMAVLAALEDG